MIGGQFWVGGGWWGPAYTSFFREVCGLELNGDLWERGKAYEETAKSACWWWPNKRFVIACERPSVINRELNDNARPRGLGSHRMHCDDGPAVEWPDGWGVWVIHGVRVPQRVVEDPQSLTVAEILAEENAEVRRIMIDRFGKERFFREANAKLLDTSIQRMPDGSQEFMNELLAIDLPGDPEGRLVAVRCIDPSTLREYFLRVPPDVNRVQQALAWTFGVSEEGYANLIQES